jgi:hypothetical protein
MTLKKFSDLDANQIIKAAADPVTGAINVNQVNDLVPTAYGRVEFTYVDIGCEEMVSTATFYGDGEFEVTGMGIEDVIGNSLDSKYFTLWSANNAEQYYVWFNSGAALDPAPIGMIGIEVAYQSNESKHVLSYRIAKAINNIPDFAAEAHAASVIITNVTHGATNPTLDIDTGFSIFNLREGKNRQIVAIVNFEYDNEANLTGAERVFYA